jgi:hypothetical protein
VTTKIETNPNKRESDYDNSTDNFESPFAHHGTENLPREARQGRLQKIAPDEAMQQTEEITTDNIKFNLN